MKTFSGVNSTINQLPLLDNYRPKYQRSSELTSLAFRPHLDKKIISLMSLSLILILTIPSLAHGTSPPTITCDGLAGNPYRYTLSATIGGYSPDGRQIMHATVDWGDGTANILTVSTGTCPSSTFVAHFGTDSSPGHTYATPSGRDAVYYNVTMTLMDSSGLTSATWMMFWVQDPPASSVADGGGGVTPYPHT